MEDGQNARAFLADSSKPRIGKVTLGCSGLKRVDQTEKAIIPDRANWVVKS